MSRLVWVCMWSVVAVTMVTVTRRRDMKPHPNCTGMSRAVSDRRNHLCLVPISHSDCVWSKELGICVGIRNGVKDGVINLCIIYGLNYIALFLSHVIQSCVSNWTNFLKIYIENKTEM